MSKLRIIICLLIISILSSCANDSSFIFSELQEQIITTLEADYVETNVYLDIKTKNTNLEIDNLISIKSLKENEGIISNLKFNNSMFQLYGISPKEVFIDERDNIVYFNSNNKWAKIDMSQFNEGAILTDINKLVSNVLQSMKKIKYIEDHFINEINYKHYELQVSLNDNFELVYNIISQLCVNLPNLDDFIVTHNLGNVIKQNKNVYIDIYINKSSNKIGKIKFNVMQLIDIIKNLDSELIDKILLNIDPNDLLEYNIGLDIDNLDTQTTLTIPDAAKVAPIITYNEFINNYNDIFTKLDYEIILNEHFTSIKHPSQPIIYFIDQPNMSLIKYNVDTNKGQTIKFPYLPEKLIFANNKIYVTLLKGPHNLSPIHDQMGGAYAVISADDIEDYEIFHIGIDPFDIVATNDGLLYILNGENNQYKIDIYDKYNYKIAEWINYGMLSINYNPIYNKLYLIDQQRITNSITIPINVESLKYDTFSKTFTNYKSIYNGEHPLEGKMYISPDGKYMFNTSGVIYSCDSNIEDDMKYIKTLEHQFTSIEFNIDDNEFYLLSKTKIYKYEYESLTLKSSISIDSGIKSIYYVNEKLYLVGNNDNNTFITSVNFID